ncbi:hypothetical protein DPMN_193949 [Dreissena polymorpha]|uniref:Uncharacterized protein n=1 Tax=Dreissena polymorpha TaxID=45954 RepID=A0A9D3Y342_DREPO|nr:hypothetical protein DPMN_193949 [Dreissena polymorpha]
MMMEQELLEVLANMLVTLLQTGSRSIMALHRQSVAGRIMRMRRATAATVVSQQAFTVSILMSCVEDVQNVMSVCSVPLLETEERLIMEMANKLMVMLENVHERARRPLTREIIERRQTLSERQVHQLDSVSSESSDTQGDAMDPFDNSNKSSKTSSGSGDRTPPKRKRLNSKYPESQGCPMRGNCQL